MLVASRNGQPSRSPILSTSKFIAERHHFPAGRRHEPGAVLRSQRHAPGADQTQIGK